MGRPGAFTWAELSARGMDKAVAFYARALGWTTRTMPKGEGQPPYVLFMAGDQSIAGGIEMSPMVPSEVPSYWMVYFAVSDADATFKKAIDAGGHEVLAPQDFPGGRSAVVGDPQGAVFAIRSVTAR
jgi:predicted enzyme related to lactoylglutathione lyase